MKDKLENGLLMLGLLAFLYTGCYFAAVRRGPTFEWSNKWVAFPSYAGLPEAAEDCFRPLHEWDRIALRPGFWAGTISLEEWRQKQLLIVEAFRKEAREAAEQK